MSIRFYFLLTLLFIATRAIDQQVAVPDWQLIWSEEFNEGSSVNKTKWTFQKTCSPHNQELQCYTDRTENAYIADGALVIKVKDEPSYNSKKRFTSARIYTQCEPDGRGTFHHGRFEMRAILPNAKHLWPAFWLIPSDNHYGGWPLSGEIDIMEYRGQETNKISSALHYGSPHRSDGTGPKLFDGVDFSSTYHIFALEWDATTFRFMMDGNTYWTSNINRNWGKPYTKNGQPWDQRFHIIINLAVGGNFFNGYGTLTDKDVKAWKQPYMTVDYVRVYRDMNANEPAVTTGLPSACGRQKAAASVVNILVGVGVAIAVIVVLVVSGVLFVRWRRERRMNYSVKLHESHQPVAELTRRVEIQR